MDFLIGLLAGISICSGPMVFLFIGWKQKRKPVEVDDEEVKKAKQNRKDFINMMNYNVETATARKKVT